MAKDPKGRDAKRSRREVTREERLKGQEQADARRRQRERIIYAGIAVVVVAIVGLTGWSAFKPKPGEQFPNQGGDHIAPGRPHATYNSNPPTSGWHYAETVPPGAYPNEIPDEIAIHNLEHGCIWVSYKDPKDSDMVAKLEGLAARFPLMVVLSPRPKNDSPIAVAAWRRLLKLQKHNEGQIVEFIRAFRNKGPESLNCVGGMTPR